MNRNEVICISGCSSGIGRALAERLAAQGAIVYAGLRELEAHSSLTGARPLQLDVTRADQAGDAMRTIERECGRLDVLINNAGVNVIGPWELTPTDVVRRAFEVNFFGAVELTKAALPLMRSQRDGHILMVSSLSALVALPAGGVYAASKSALEAFAESLSYEVRRWNIRVSIVNPGGYATALDVKSWRPSVPEGPYAPLTTSLRAPSAAGAGSAEEAADRIIKVLSEPPGRLRHPLDDTGRRIFHELRWDIDREPIARAASGLGWWLNGADAEDGQP